MSFPRQLQNCCKAFGLALTAMISLATPTAPAQIIYVSDNRSVSVAVGLDTNNAFFSLGGLASVSYSGDASGSVSPYTPYADFNSGINGNVNISSAYNG